MGQNSTEVAYGFGQFGSAFTDTADAPIYPPKGMVIVAVTFTADTYLEVCKLSITPPTPFMSSVAPLENILLNTFII